MTHPTHRRPCRRLRSWRTLLTAMLLGFAAGVANPGDAEAQVPDSFTNLQFFDEEISRSELIGAMREFSFALDVRCQYCHSGGDGRSFEGVDFASDSKPEKQRARYMLEMSQTINTTLLASVPERRSPNVEVECQTCHRGLARPEMIDDLLRRRIADDGVEAAAQEYRELREQAYGGWSYDFGEWAIFDLATEYQAEEPEISVALVTLNTEFYPESVNSWIALGQAQTAAGDTAAAIRAYREGLEVSPDDARILRMLQELGLP